MYFSCALEAVFYVSIMYSLFPLHNLSIGFDSVGLWFLAKETVIMISDGHYDL